MRAFPMAAGPCMTQESALGAQLLLLLLPLLLPLHLLLPLFLLQLSLTDVRVLLFIVFVLPSPSSSLHILSVQV